MSSQTYLNNQRRTPRIVERRPPNDSRGMSAFDNGRE
ncbi:MAG: hypothetical protein RL375_2055, partial [Pseudomonadota bacterium]